MKDAQQKNRHWSRLRRSTSWRATCTPEQDATKRLDSANLPERVKLTGKIVPERIGAVERPFILLGYNQPEVVALVEHLMVLGSALIPAYRRFFLYCATGRTTFFSTK